MNSINMGTGQIRSYVETIFLNKWKLFAYNLLVLALATLFVVFLPRTYHSEAKIWIKLGRENSKLDPTAATGKTIAIQQNDREDEIKSVIDVLGSRGVITAAVERLGPAVVLGDEPLPGADAAELPGSNPVVKTIKNILGSVLGVLKSIDPISEREEAIQEVIENLSVDAERKSNVVSISFESKTPALSQAVVSTVLDEYRSEHNRINTTAGSRTFFDTQRSRLQKLVSEASEALRKAKSGIGIASVGGQQRILEEQMSHVQRAKLDAVQQVTESQARIERIDALLKMHPPKITSEERTVPNTGRDTIRSRLFELQVQRMELEAKLSNHPKLEMIKQQEDDARRELTQHSSEQRTETTESLNQVHQMLISDRAIAETGLAGLQAKLKSLNLQEQSILTKINELNAADVDIQQLERSVQLAVTNYITYEENYEDARIDEALNLSTISNIGIAQLPTFEEKPVGPKKILLVAMTLALMSAGSAAIVVGAPWISSSLRRPDDIEAVLEAPVIAAVPGERRYSEVLN